MPALLTANLQLAPSLSAQLATFHRWKKDLKGESARPRSCSKRAAELGMGPRPPYFSEDQPEGGTSWARWGQGHDHSEKQIQGKSPNPRQSGSRATVLQGHPW